MKCSKCKRELRIGQEQIGVNEQNMPILKTFCYCDYCRMKYDYEATLKTQPKKDSALSIWAAILAFFTCTCFIGGILGIIDLCINDKTKRHLGSWFALVFCAIYLIIGGCTILGSNGSSADDTAPNNIGTSEIIVTTAPSETVVETPASEEVVIEYQQVEANLLLTTLEENALRAENTYQDAYLEITGQLSVIDSDGKYIGIDDGNFTMINISCYVTDESQLDTILEMNIGDTVVVKGQVTDIGEVLGYFVDIHDLEIVTE